MRSPALSKRADSTSSSCVDPDPQNTLTDRMNIALNSSGPGFILSLCQGTDYYIEAPINFAAHDQEISTEGYPIEEEDGTDLRATLIVSGPVANGQGHTTAIQGGWCNIVREWSPRRAYFGLVLCGN